MRWLPAAAVAVCLLIAICTVEAQTPPPGGGHWPHWRGAGRENISTDTGLLKEWPEGGPPLAWTVEGLGNGYSTVTIVDGKLYTQGTIRGQEQVIAIDLATQQKLWMAAVGGGGKSQSTPSYSDGLLYALAFDGTMVCVDAKDGKEVWRKHLQKDLGGGKTPGWSFAESPYVDGHRVVITPGGEDSLIAALNRNTGDVLWRTALPDGLRGKKAHAQYATVAATTVGGVKQYLTLIMPLGLVSVAAEDGRFLWNYQRIANGTANIPTSVAVGDYVFCSTAYGTGAALLKLTGDSAEQVYWLDSGTFQNHHGGFLRIGEFIYGGSGHNAGNPTCIEWKTGKVMWQAKQPGGGSGSCIAADGHLYFLYQEGQVALIEATPDGYKLKGLFSLPKQGGPAWAHPVVCGGKLYLRWADKLFCYDVMAK